MKLGPYLLINLLMVGGGIFIYDNLKSDTGSGSDAPVYDPLTAEAPSRDEPTPAPEPMELDGGANDVTNRDNTRRINSLERTIADLREELRSLKGSNGGGTTTSGNGVMPSMASSDLVDEENPVFDDGTLSTISAYLDEINRRKNEERQMRRIETELERKDIDLSESQKESVVKETLAYQAKARDLLRKQFSRDEAGREERRQAFQGLQDEYASVIKSLVPEQQADQILDSRLGRGMGFFGNFGGGGNNRGGMRRGRNR